LDSLAITRPWYNLAAILIAAATTPSQKGNWKLPETDVSTLVHIKKFDGKFTIAEPEIGTLTPNNEAIELKINKPETKAINEKSGFL
jgi:hypothetical protein